MTAERRPPSSKAEKDMLAELERLKSGFSAQRLRIFREYLAHTVCLASPLLLDICREGELDEVMWSLRPPEKWPNVIDIRRPIRGWSSKSARHGPLTLAFRDPHTGERIQVQDQLALRLTHRAAHMIWRIGPMQLRTIDAGGMLRVSSRDATLATDDLAATPLEAIVDHPPFVGRGYLAMFVRDKGASRKNFAVLGAPAIEWRPPWARPWEVPF